nr:MAG: hypothetical protein [Microviridae sp.]
MGTNDEKITLSSILITVLIALLKAVVNGQSAQLESYIPTVEEQSAIVKSLKDEQYPSSIIKEFKI